jgi:HAD superfamily hydrolase (TIGR01490 family)
VSIAFFDLDRTLLAVNSGGLWVRREVALGRLSKRQALQAVAWLARYALGLAEAETTVEFAVRQLRGTSAESYRRRTSDFYELVLTDAFRPGGFAALERHRADADVCVLLTSSSEYLAALAAKDLGIETVCCNRFEVDLHGLHTGRLSGGACFGAGKLAHAQEVAQRLDFPLAQCTFYTDSASDLPVLRAVGSPVAVNPDPRLRRFARRSGWRIEDWGEPQSRPAGNAGRPGASTRVPAGA